MTAYNPLIPQSYNLISVSQSAILANFTQLNTQFNIEHTDLVTGSTTGSPSGYHKQATMPNQASLSTVVPATGQGTYYTSQTNTFSTTTQAVYKSGDSGSTSVAILSAVKAWAYFTISGTTAAILDSYNIESMTRVSAGQWTVTMSSALTSAVYGVIGSTYNFSGIGRANILNFSPSSTTSFTLYFYATSALADPTGGCFAVLQS